MTPEHRTTPPSHTQAPGHAPRLAVFVSGTGRSLDNLIRRHARGELDATPALVVASRTCKALDIAHNAGITTRTVTAFQSTHQLEAVLAEHNIQLVALAGYLKRLPVPDAYRERILNIHPALLPSHGGPGMFGINVHRAVIDAGDTESGCTVHLVNDEYDAGPVIAQARCPVLPSDTPESLAARVFELEQDLYPRVINDHTAHLHRQ